MRPGRKKPTMRAVKRRPPIPSIRVILLTMSFALLAGCASAAGGGGLAQDFGGKHWPEEYGDHASEGHEFEEIVGWSSGSEAVYALPEQEAYGPDSKISMVLFNTGEEELSYGIEYRIQRKAGKHWRKVPFGKPVAIEDLGIVLPPGGIWRQKVQLENFPPGTYRYIKSVRFAESGTRKDVYGEFAVESNAESRPNGVRP